MRKLRFLLLSLLFVPGCGGDSQLRSEVADLRVSMKAMEARQDVLETGESAPEVNRKIVSPWGDNDAAGGSPWGRGNDAELTAGNEKLLAKVERLEATQAELLERLNKPPPRRPQRPRPAPSSVYSIDISGSPYKGVRDAKVTIVQAFEFA